MAEHRSGDIDVHDVHEEVPSGPPGDPDRDINTRMLWRVGIGLVVGSIVSGIVILGIFLFEKKHLEKQDPAPSPMAEAREVQLPPGPRLQKDPTAEMAAFRAAEEKTLTTWGWTDQAAGIARMPVTRAAEIVLAQGVGPLNPPPAEEQGGAR